MVVVEDFETMNNHSNNVYLSYSYIKYLIYELGHLQSLACRIHTYMRVVLFTQ